MLNVHWTKKIKELMKIIQFYRAISEDDYTKKIFLEICESTYLNIGEFHQTMK